MKVIVEIEKADLVAMNFYVAPRAKSNRIIFSLIFVVFLFVYSLSHELPSALISALVITICGFVGLMIFALVCSVFYSSEKNGTLGYHKFEVTPEGFHEKTPSSSSFLEWSAVHDVVVLKNVLYVFQAPWLIHVIPNRHFESKEHYERFSSKVMGYWRENA